MHTIHVCWLLSLCAVISTIHCLPDFQERLPNGHRVPHPCFVNTVWKGVGHQNSEGGGFLNPFGEDFKANNYQWDTCLCMADSDGDGMSNGQELGDPYCTWSGTGLPDVIDGLSHPGVCEPLNATICEDKNRWEVCAPLNFQCDNVDNDPDVEELHLRFLEHRLPAIETSYFCQAVEFDDTKEMHAIAMEPLIDNHDLVHHIDLSACTDTENADQVREIFSKPRPCGAMLGCGGNLIAAWALGINGICLPENVGMRIGKGGDTLAMLRIHYHNPFLRKGETDSSGLLLYATENLREDDAQIINAGNAYLEIPPRMESFHADNQCHSGCTSQMNEDIYFMFGAMHMHYLGTGGYSEIWRDGEFVETIMRQDFYDYNAPHMQYFVPPIKFSPGDEIRYRCSYQSRDRTEVTYRGKSASDEMCNIYLVYYPIQNLSRCNDDGAYMRGLHSCKFRYADSKEYIDMGECDWGGSYKPKYEAYLRDIVLGACDDTGETCLDGCAEIVEWALTNDTCLIGNARDPTIEKYDHTFMRAMHSCKIYPTSEPPGEETGGPVFGGNCTINVQPKEGPPTESTGTRVTTGLLAVVNVLCVGLVASGYVF